MRFAHGQNTRFFSQSLLILGIKKALPRIEEAFVFHLIFSQSGQRNTCTLSAHQVTAHYLRRWGHHT